MCGAMWWWPMSGCIPYSWGAGKMRRWRRLAHLHDSYLQVSETRRVGVEWRGDVIHQTFTWSSLRPSSSWPNCFRKDSHVIST
ncbi:uncharacterized protein EI97DRAFT_265646 [Westerdykella ornata]|uniref:Uncharacterized protein n=1 Tax=Westerdykella ornata TaxID=318751 RepID=A0A6A6J5W2_WESOR|nr:uncharacterized protein EI97DRAFT_265646 [Westerdykella ornata]KAF2271523.1 hypothetical protein EI97DRAFT_265646 [Westerdykella ornata]